MQALELLITGAVQGVGFRPFVYRLAHEMGLGGTVWNEPRGVRVRVVGPDRTVEDFCWRVKHEAPAPALVDSLRLLEARTADGPEPFRIAESEDEGARTATIMADLATCPACLRELLDPADRRHRYPFINCTHCGPRFSIVADVPYDRPHTTMRAFTQCPACQAEYDDPANRRFHAQPNACPVCGPHLALWDARGAPLSERDSALREAAAALRDGKIVAVKGLGGFQLLCDAARDDSVRLLRTRKQREEKPFALMVTDLTAARALALVSDLEADLLQSAAAPIVLLQRRRDAAIAESVAPSNPNLGLMLPTTPLHHMLLREVDRPVVATSGNASDEPLCTDERDALQRLGALADLFLVHNRPIARAVDDSVVRVMAGRPCVLRRARGYAPLPIPLALEAPPILALGSHLKNTVALARGAQVVVSQHVGDLDTLEARNAFERAVEDIQQLYDIRPAVWVADRHPDYAPNLWARGKQHGVQLVQHHHAHIAAAMAEHGLEGPVLGMAWDGTGLGTDQTIWGGEFLRCTRAAFQRVGHLRPFHLPGGEAAAREPWRSALGVLAACGDGRADTVKAMLRAAGLDDLFAARRLDHVLAALERGTGTIVTTSAGRLFDAVSSLLRLRQVSSYEGQAAMAVEWAAATAADPPPSLPPCTMRESDPLVLDWVPMLRGLLEAQRRGAASGDLAAAFHDSLVEGMAAIARNVALHQVVLGGGCFQNRLLLESLVRRLRADGFAVYWPQLVPPNDGGISLGQAAVAAYGGV